MQETLRVRNQASWQQGCILVAAGFLPIMAIIAISPTLPTLLAHFRGVMNPQIVVPLLITVPSACIALLSPFAGVVVDRFGRRRLMLFSMALYGSGGLIPFLADSLSGVIASRVVIGIAEAGILTVTNTLLADYFDEASRHRWLTIQGVCGAILGSLMTACSGYLAAVGWQWPFAVYALAFPIFLAALFYLYEPAARSPVAPPQAEVDVGASRPAGAFPTRRAVLICGVTAVLAVIYFVQIINFSLVLKGLGVDDPRRIGLAMALPTLGVPVGSLLFKFSTRLGTARQIALVLALYAVGLTGIGLAADYRVALGFAFLQQIANGIVVPVLIAWVAGSYAFLHRGRGMGLWASSFFLAQFLSPACVALMKLGTGDLQGAFTAFGLLSALLCLAVFLGRRQFGDAPALIAVAAR